MIQTNFAKLTALVSEQLTRWKARSQTQQLAKNLIRIMARDAQQEIASLTNQLAALAPVATPTPFSREIPQITTEMKAQFMGEFSWEQEAPYYDEDGELHEDHIAKHTVPWDLCKRIYQEMAAFAASPHPNACEPASVETGIGGALAQTMIKRSETTQ